MLAPRKCLALLSAVYFLLVGAVCVYVFKTFGATNAIGLAVILGIPLAIALQLWWKWPVVRRREIGYLGVLAVLVTGATVGLIRDWRIRGMDRWHMMEIRRDAFEQFLRADPAFARLVFDVSPKGFVVIRGLVATEADLDRLRRSETRYGVPCTIEATVTGPRVVEPDGLPRPKAVSGAPPGEGQAVRPGTTRLGISVTGAGKGPGAPPMSQPLP